MTVSSTDVLAANVAALRDDVTELKADSKSLREKVDKNFERLCTKIEETNKALHELSKTVVSIDSKLSTIVRVGGGIIALVTLAITVGKAFKWF